MQHLLDDQASHTAEEMLLCYTNKVSLSSANKKFLYTEQTVNVIYETWDLVKQRPEKSWRSSPPPYWLRRFQHPKFNIFWAMILLQQFAYHWDILSKNGKQLSYSSFILLFFIFHFYLFVCERLSIIIVTNSLHLSTESPSDFLKLSMFIFNSSIHSRNLPTWAIRPRKCFWHFSKHENQKHKKYCC